MRIITNNSPSTHLLSAAWHAVMIRLVTFSWKFVLLDSLKIKQCDTHAFMSLQPHSKCVWGSENIRAVSFIPGCLLYGDPCVRTCTPPWPSCFPINVCGRAAVFSWDPPREGREVASTSSQWWRARPPESKTFHLPVCINTRYVFCWAKPGNYSATLTWFIICVKSFLPRHWAIRHKAQYQAAISPIYVCMDEVLQERRTTNTHQISAAFSANSGIHGWRNGGVRTCVRLFLSTSKNHKHRLFNDQFSHFVNIKAKHAAESLSTLSVAEGPQPPPSRVKSARHNPSCSTTRLKYIQWVYTSL